MKTALSVAAALLVATPSAARQAAPATPEARAALADFARCVAGNSRGKAQATLARDFTTKLYREELRSLASNNRDCFERRGSLRAGGLPLAAALAEVFLAEDPRPLNVRLLRAASVEVRTYSRSDAVAMCIARSDPDNAAALLRSAIGSAEEIKAAADLQVAVGRCTPAGVTVDLGAYGLRSIVATAAYRLLEAAE